ncbi:MAG: hypothetical protein ACRCYY_10315 [Trueperaceae bacterium]
MIPEYWLKRPDVFLDDARKERLERLWSSLSFENIPLLENLPVPKWVFLCWLAEEKNMLLHGSGDLNIGMFEPRAPDAKDDNRHLAKLRKGLFYTGK